MAKFISFTSILLGLFSTLAAETADPRIKTFNDSVTSDSSKGTTLEEIDEVFGRPQEDTWIWGVTDASSNTNTTSLDENVYDIRELIGLPESFDAREQWPKCRTLHGILDQGACNGGWALASVAAITDRYCIASNETKQFYASAEDALTCSEGGNCRGGGDSKKVYLYWKDHGIASGGRFNSRIGCKPFRIPPCPIHNRGLPCHPQSFIPPQRCMPYCIRGYPSSYDKDLKFASEVYQLKLETDIKADIFNNGPVTAFMKVFEDFFTYRQGIYKHKSGKFWYGHHVKLIGWGEENGVKYWLGANSWNVQWGERGYFRILRGENHCEIETIVIGGKPKL